MSPLASKQGSSRKWLARLGFGIVLVGVLFFTPATDLLPVDILFGLQPGPQPAFLRVVRLEGDRFFVQPAFAIVGTSLVLFGAALIALVRLSLRQERS